MKRFTIDDFRERYPDEDACLDKLFQLRFKGLVCPKCENDKPFVRVKNRRCYHCPDCCYQVYPCKDTIFEKSTTPLTYWFYAIFLQTTTRNGVAAKELERQLNVCYKTALRMSHQIKILMADKSIGKLKGVVQIDEVYLGGRIDRWLQRNYKKIDPEQITKYDNKVGVMGFVSDQNEMKFEVMDGSQTFKDRVKKNVAKEATVVTDGHAGYDGLDLHYAKHEVVNHAKREFKRGNYHVNNVENVWSILRRTIEGTHISVSRKHLQKYVDEVAFRLMNKDRQDEMFEIILSHVV